MVPFNTKAGLDSALTGITGVSTNVYIWYSGPGTLPNSTNFAAGTFYSGSGSLTISSSSGTVYTIASKNPTGPVVIDFGCSHNIWDATKITANYVKFSYTGTSNIDCFYIHDCSNLRIYGGEFNSGIGGAAIRMRGQNTSIRMWDQYVAQAGSHGIQIQPADPSTGAAKTIDSCNFRLEVTRFCMNPTNDPHPDKGSGFHGCLWQDTNHGTISNSTIALKATNPLQQGETSAGQTWPEGGGGSGIEIGSVGDSTSNNTFFILAENMHMKPTGTNPGSTAQQTGGNAVNHWGSIPLNGHVFGWVEGNDLTGAVTHGAGGGWFPGSPAITVNHGRHNNVNQSTAGSNISTPYDTAHSIVYNDST